MIVQSIPYPGFIDPHWASVLVLTGWDAATVGDTTDDSTYAHDIQWGGGAGSVVSTTAKFGARSLQRTATGANNYAFIDDNPNLAFGSSAFTVETWVRFDTAPTSGAHYLLGQYDTGANQRAWALQVNSGVLRLLVSADGITGTEKAAAAWAPSTGVWYHVVGDFDGTTYRTYVDGVMMASATGAVTMFNSTARLTFTAALLSGSGQGSFIGRIDETRITKGVARYASNGGYSVPVAAFPRG